MSTRTTADPTTEAGRRPTPDPEPILRVASGFMGSKHLCAATELGIFEALADSPADLDALGARTGLTRRAARITADAMVALGFLEREGDRYRNSEVAATFLAGRPGPDLRPVLRHFDVNSYPAWADLARALAEGPKREALDFDEEHQEIASAGIEAMMAGPANALVRVYDFSAHQRLLDVGGGTGSWAIAAVRHHPGLQATVFERPQVGELARQRIAGEGLGSRIGVAVGDFLEEDLPGGHDVFLLANVVHYWSPEKNVGVLSRVRKAAEPGGRLLVADFWTDRTHTQPVMAALMAGHFAAQLREGDVYSVEEARQWLPQAGWRFLEHKPLAGPQSVVVAEAV